MKKILLLLIGLVALGANIAQAELPITIVDKIDPTNEVFMDMATTAASKAKSEGNVVAGAVVILNGAWKGTGTATADATAEENAIAKSRLTSLQHADIYTINEPTTQAYNAICRMGARTIYFVNGRDQVVAAGIYPADAYADDQIDTAYPAVPLKQMTFDDASQIIK